MARRSSYYALTPLVMLSMIIIMTGHSYAYAEEVTVDVPFAVAHQQCNSYVDPSRQGIEMLRCWFTNEVLDEDYQPDTLVPQTPEEVTADESAEPILVEETQPAKEAAKLTDIQRRILALEAQAEREELSTADTELLRALKTLTNVCEIGIEHGERIQKYAMFALPTEDPRTDYASINFKTNQLLGAIEKKIQECMLWDKYRETHLGQRYLDLVVDDSTSQGYHANVAKGATTYPTDKITEHDFIEEERRAMQAICESHLYSMTDKKSKGCDIEYEATALPDRTNPMDTNSAYKNYKEYLTTGGSVDLSTLKKSEVQKAKIDSLDSFAQQWGIDVEALKQLVQGDKDNP